MPKCVRNWRVMMLALSMVVMLWLGAPAAQGQGMAASGDRAAVHQAALDYLDAIYMADPARIERSVHPSLTKLGWVRRPTGEYASAGTMTYDQLFALAGTWNKNGNQDTSVKQVDVLDVLDQTAVAKVTAQWGVDFMQLAKFDGQWKIVNIVWQTPPVK